MHEPQRPIRLSGVKGRKRVLGLDLSSLLTLSVVKNNLLTQILLPKKASKYCESMEYFC